MFKSKKEEPSVRKVETFHPSREADKFYNSADCIPKTACFPNNQINADTFFKTKYIFFSHNKINI